MHRTSWTAAAPTTVSSSSTAVGLEMTAFRTTLLALAAAALAQPTATATSSATSATTTSSPATSSATTAATTSR